MWRQASTLRTSEDEHRERRVTWLELFFDLYFVVAISEATHYLSEQPSLSGVDGFIFFKEYTCDLVAISETGQLTILKFKNQEDRDITQQH